jgi:hypothetical protein
MKEWMSRLEPPRFGELKVVYGLRVLNNARRDRHFFDASSRLAPGLRLEFLGSGRSRNVAEFTLFQLHGPASVMLPDYVGMRYESIPGFERVWADGGRLQDSFGHYSITFSDLEAKTMSGNDAVDMSG